MGNVVIPEEVTYYNKTRKVTCIGYHAFKNCTSLTSVTIPNSVTYIDEGAFSGCKSLTSVEIPNSVIFIMYAAFNGCRSLTSVTIPSSVKQIGSYAFYDSKLSTIVSLIEDPFAIVGKGQIWSTFSDDTFRDATLYVPVGSVEKYKTTYGWKDFSHIVPLDEGMSVKVMENDNNSPSEYFLLNGQQVDQPQKGLNIVKTGKKW